MNESSRHYAGWRAAFACAAGSFFASFPYYTFALFLKPVSAEFSWSRESVAAAYATMAFTAAAAAPFLGRVIDRVGARRVIVPALIVLGLAVASLSMLTPSLQHLYAVGVVIGVASIGASAVAYARVIFGWFDTYRGRALGIMLAGGMVSTIVLPPIVVRLIDALGWRTSWGLLGVVMLVGALPIVVTFLHEKPAARTGPQKVEAAGYTVGAAIRTRRFWTLIIVIFGWKRLPDAARRLGRSARVFKSEVDEMKKETEANKSAAATETVKGESITRERTSTDTSADRVVPAPEDGNAVHERAPRTDNQSGPVA